MSITLGSKASDSIYVASMQEQKATAVGSYVQKSDISSTEIFIRLKHQRKHPPFRSESSPNLYVVSSHFKPS